jgi:hypothetical protein
MARECVSILEDTARARDLVSYSDLAQAITSNLGLSPPVDYHLELSHILYDAVLLGLESWPEPDEAPLLSAIAVYKDVREPGPGHITLAKQLGRKPGIPATRSSISGGARSRRYTITTRRERKNILCGRSLG